MVERIPVDSSTRALTGETNAYIIGSEDALLIDPARVTEELEAAIDQDSIGHVAVTHHHPDHVGGVADAAVTHDLTVWARAGRTDHFVSATGVDPDRVIEPGSMLPVTGGIRCIDTPGHAVEHLAFETAEGIISGDLALASGSVVVGGPGADMRAYLTSLRRLHAMNPATLFPAHGPRIDDSRAVLERLLAHRLRREALVRTAIQSGLQSPDAIVDAVYKKDLTGVYELAKATVIAHIEKLAHEGTVRWDGSLARSVGASG